MLNKTNTLRSSSSTLVNTHPHTIESARSGKFKRTFSSNNDFTSIVGFSPDRNKNIINTELILIKKEKQESNKNIHKLSAITFKKHSKKSLHALSNLTANSVISEKDERNGKSDKNSFVQNTSNHTLVHNQANALNSHNNTNSLKKQKLKIIDNINNTEFLVKPILKKIYVHRMGGKYNSSTPSNPSSKNLNKLTKNKNVKFVDCENYVKDEEDEMVLITPKPLAQVISVESYRNFNIYFGDKDDCEANEKKTDKAVCQCSCQIF